MLLSNVEDEDMVSYLIHGSSPCDAKKSLLQSLLRRGNKAIGFRG